MKSVTRIATAVAAVAVAVAGVTGATATAYGAEPASPPKTIALPNDGMPDGLGYQPEGIETVGDTAYISSFTDGRVMKVNLRTGDVKPLVEADGDHALGLHVTGRLLLVAGQTSGELRVYDRFTGEQLENHEVPGAELLNDITVTGDTAYVTDSYKGVLHAFPLRADGRGLGEPRTIRLGGDFELVKESELGRAFNGNGITAIDAHTVLVAQTDSPDDPYGNSSELYRVDTRTGDARRVTVHGGPVLGADGIELRGSTLHVAQHSENTIAELKLSRDGTSATHVRTIEDSDLAVPTNLAFGRGGDLYAVNSRFDVPSSGRLTYEVVRVRR
ncbi:YncE family protein [Streptomyces sp. NPDC048172]|uniref:YncE family protein n=1 Tax=Streptomyces sp. NPDC048172 TaxID=3365505 RepID=UPI003721CFB2